MTLRIFSLLFVMPYFYIAQNNDTNIIIWNKYIALKYSDFQMNKDISDTNALHYLYVDKNYAKYLDYKLSDTTDNLQENAARSAFNIHLYYYIDSNDTFRYNISAVFLKYMSYMIIHTKDVLFHEQIHFDLFELHVRKLRAKICKLTKKEANETYIDSLINSCYKEYDKDSDQFDFEDSIEQCNIATKNFVRPKWYKNIHRRLDSLKAYENPEGKVYLQKKQKQ